MRVMYRVARHRRNRRIMKDVKGYAFGQGRLLRTAKEAIKRAGQFSYRDRRARRRFFRKLWIIRLSAAVRARGISYSQFIKGLSKAKMVINRKSLSELAIADPQSFDRLVDNVRKALAA